jgi:adenosylcobinamide-phosphate synthase
MLHGARLAASTSEYAAAAAIARAAGVVSRLFRDWQPVHIEMMIYPKATLLAIAALLDLIVGDPHRLPHPVRGIGLLVTGFERLLRNLRSEIAAGCILVAAVLSIAVGFAVLTLQWAGVPAAVYWMFSCLAVRSLDRESNRVVRVLRTGDLEQARTLVGYLVGRDTQHLSEKEVTRAVFETVAENMSDAIVAPLFYLALFGVPGMVAYKAVNTMDSMIGYKNDRYIRFGRAAARLDDATNYIPARMTAGLIVVCAAILRLRWRSAIRMVLRDAHLQPSPNAGYPEAALAGALGVRLGGINYYFGQPVQKPFLGDALEDLQFERFSRVRSLLYLVSGMSYLMVMLWLW